jgi:adenylate cyclase
MAVVVGGLTSFAPHQEVLVNVRLKGRRDIPGTGRVLEFDPLRQKHKGAPAAALAETAAQPGPIRPARAPGPKAVRRQVEQVFASGDFDASNRSREFLRFVVEETLAGRAEGLTQTAIATRVFGRREDFDAVVDPIVRIQAGRLRRSLERYYLLAGQQDAVRIELPRGSYVPAFGARPATETERHEDRAPEPAPTAAPADDWPAVAISPFELVQAGPEHAESAALVTQELVLELGRYRDVRLHRTELDRAEAAGRPRTRFALGGRLRATAGGDLRVTAQLVDRATGEQVWGDEYHTLGGPDRWSGSLEDIARVIAARVGADEGVIVQLLAAEHRRRRPPSRTPYAAILRSFEFFLARDPTTLAPALQALREVVKVDPDCGAAWTRLARLCLANHAFEITPIPTPLEETITYAQFGVRVDQTSRRARCILAAALLVKGELAAARTELDDALRLSPDSLAWLEIIGHLLTLTGDGTRGPALIRTARQRNPHSLTIALAGLWFDHLRRGEFQLAYQHALEQHDPTFFWRGVMRASCLGHLGRTAESAVEVADLLRHYPDFRSRGRILIGHYIKLPEVMERVVDGLARAGLELA